jgi:hypothetical protein
VKTMGAEEKSAFCIGHGLYLPLVGLDTKGVILQKKTPPSVTRWRSNWSTDPSKFMFRRILELPSRFPQFGFSQSVRNQLQS